MRLFGMQIGSEVRPRSTVRVIYPWKLSIWDNVWVDDDRAFYNFAPITLGSNVALAHCVDLYTGLHDHTTIDLPIRAESILVEDEVWLTNDFFVGPGVNIGRGAVAAEVRPTRAYHPGWSAMARRPEPVKPRVSA